MRRTLAVPLAFSLLLTGCGGGAVSQSVFPRLEDQMKNPLYAARYWEEMTDTATQLLIAAKTRKLPDVTLRAADEVRISGLAQVDQTSAVLRQGKQGSFVSVTESTEGQALLMPGAFYLSPSFVTFPGPSLRLYLSESLDPRGNDFPDSTAMELGRLESPYGAQSYVLPARVKDIKRFRTAVLYDTRLKLMYAFAQLQ